MIKIQQHMKRKLNLSC